MPNTAMAPMPGPERLLHVRRPGVMYETSNVTARQPIDEPLQGPPVRDPPKGKPQPKRDPSKSNQSPVREPQFRRPCVKKISELPILRTA